MITNNNIPQASNNGIVAKKVTQKGKNIAGRDQYFNQVIQSNYSAFTEANFTSFENQKYFEPIFTDGLIRKVEHNRLIIVGENYEFNKHLFIKYLAYQIQKTSTKSILVKENHLTQLQKSLLKMLHYQDLIQPIAIGISKAYQEVPDEVDKTISEWLQKIYSDEMKQMKNFDFRNKIITCIISTLSEITYHDPLRLNNCYDIIKDLQEREYHSPINSHYLTFIEKQIVKHGEIISDPISSVISNVPHSLRSEVVEILKKCYKKEREKFVKGKTTIEIGGVKVLLSCNPPNFITEVEKLIFAWFKNGNKVCREIGIEMLYYFTSTVELPTQKAILEREAVIKEQRILGEIHFTPTTEKEQGIRATRPSILSRLIRYVALKQYQQYFKPHLNDLLHFLVKMRMKDEKVMKAIADKLIQYNKKGSHDISDFIAHFPKHYNDTINVLYVIGIVLIILVAIFCKINHYI